MGPDRVGNMVTTFVLLWKHPAAVFFPPKTAFPKLLDMVIFQKMCFCRTPLKHKYVFSASKALLGRDTLNSSLKRS